MDEILSVIIPAYNEENTIVEILEKVKKIPINKEIIIVDDNSTDDTLIKIISFAKNQGKGKAIKEALKYVKGDKIIIQDADLEYNPNEYLKLLKGLESSDIVYGTRRKANNPKSNWLYYLGGQSLSWITNILFRCRLTDVYTCYKLFPTKIIKSLNLVSDRFEIEAELTAKALKGKYKIKEIPISYTPRLKGKKIKFIDWIKGVYVLLKVRFLWIQK